MTGRDNMFPFQESMIVAAGLARGIDDALAIVLRRNENDWAREFLLAPGTDPAGDIAMLANSIAFAHAVAGRSSGLAVPCVNQARLSPAPINLRESEQGNTGEGLRPNPSLAPSTATPIVTASSSKPKAAVSSFYEPAFSIPPLPPEQRSFGSTFSQTPSSAEMHPATGADVVFSSVDWLMIPAWNQGTICVGLTVLRINDTRSASGEVEPARFAIGRFLKDLKTLETLFISRNIDHPTRLAPQNGISLYSDRFVSSTQRSHFFAFCDPDLFNAGHYVESVRISASGTLLRDCPICGMPPVFICSCQMIGMESKSALNFTTLFPSLLMNVGAFHGASEIVLRCPRTGRFMGLSSAGTDWLRVIRDSDMCSFLRQVAIHNVTKDGSPSRNVMPGMVGSAAEWFSQKVEGVAKETLASSSGMTAGERYELFSLNSAELESDWKRFDVDPAQVFETLLKGAFGQERISRGQSFKTGRQAVPKAEEILEILDVEVDRSRSACENTVSKRNSVSMSIDKDEIRKARNRASAARSNTKKKLYFELLERKVGEVRQKVQDLQAKQAALITYNRNLSDLLLSKSRHD